MNILQYYFEELIQCAGVVYFAIFLLVALVKAPHTPIYRPYRRAKWMFAGAYASLSANLFLWCLFNSGNWDDFNYNIAIADIILFYLEYMLMCNAFCVLLNKEYVTRRRIVVDFGLWGITLLTELSALLPCMAAYRNELVLLGLVMLMGYICRFAFTFFREYRRCKERLDNYFTEDMQRFIKWTSRSVGMCLVSWCMAIVSMYADIYFNWLLQIYVVSLHIYIVVSFINYAERYADVALADQGSAVAETAADGSADVDVDEAERDTVERKIDRWLADRKYLTEQLTIDDLAKAIGTNKSYLSYHINERYGVSFSSWIAGMRIDEAKRMMRENPDRKLESIAFSTGFSSASYFSKVFSMHEGISPTRWRSEALS